MAASSSAQPTLRSSKNQDPKIAAAIKNRKSPITSKCPCKRKFTEFATPLERHYLPKLKREWAPTIGDFIAAGGDPSVIMPHTCQLTNDIHPVLGDGNLCVCPEMINPSDFFDDDWAYCMAPFYADSDLLEGLVKKPRSPSIHPKDNTVMRTILQLASRMITDEGTLPFWAGIINAVTGEGEDAKIAFKVHPRRKLSKTRKEKTLRYLEEVVANNVRFHFKAFRDPDGSVDKYTCGVTGPEVMSEADPVYWAYHNDGDVVWYGHRDGVRTHDADPIFPHICINIATWRVLRPLQTLRDMTISEIKLQMFHHATTIFHELSHALEFGICGTDKFQMPPLNDETAVETGFALEKFIFGGVVKLDHKRDPIVVQQWPAQSLCDAYAEEGSKDTIDLIRPGDAGPDRFIPVEPEKVEAFFLQSFWDDPNPPVGSWKKMWLRPAVFAALNRKDFDDFTIGDSPPFEPGPNKRRKLTSDKKRVQSRVGWNRRKEIAGERKAEFYERERERLNELWAECMRGI